MSQSKSADKQSNGNFIYQRWGDQIGKCYGCSFLCRGPESNRYDCFQSQDFKSCASASSATPASSSERRGSNPRPPPWQGDVLPLNYVRIRFFPLMPATWLEHATLWLQIRCSTNWAKPAYLLCGWRDLNPHAVKRQILNLVRLPIPPHPHIWPVLGSNQWPID